MANINLQINARGTNVSAQRRDNNVVIDIDNTATEAATVAAGAATATALAAATSAQQIGEQVQADAAAVIGQIDTKVADAIDGAVETVETLAAEAGQLAAAQSVITAVAASQSYGDQLVAGFTNFIDGKGEFPMFDTQMTGIVLTDQPQLILPADPYRLGALIQCPDADVIFAFNTQPSDGAQFIFYDGPPTFTQEFSKPAIWAKARWSNAARTDPVSAPFSVRVRRSISGDVPTVSFADTILAHMPDPMDVRFYGAMRKAINDLHTSGDWSSIGYVFVPGASEANNKIDLVDPTRPAPTYIRGASGTGITTTPYSSVKCNGSDAAINTGLSVSALGMTFSNQALFCLTDGSVMTATGYPFGTSGSLAINPLHTATTAAARSGGGTDQFTAGAGDIVGFSRLSATEFQTYVNGAPVGAPVQRTVSSATCPSSEHSAQLAA